MTDAEKGDAVLSLWANYDKYETINDVVEAIKANPRTVEGWVSQSRRVSPKVKQYVILRTLRNHHVRMLLKYPHSVQEKLAKVIIDRNITASEPGPLRPFLKLYDANSQRDLNEIADEVLGIETVTVPKDKLPPEVLEQINNEKEQLAKVQRIRKKPSKPITKEQARKKLTATRRVAEKRGGKIVAQGLNNIETFRFQRQARLLFRICVQDV